MSAEFPQNLSTSECLTGAIGGQYSSKESWKNKAEQTPDPNSLFLFCLFTGDNVHINPLRFFCLTLQQFLVGGSRIRNASRHLHLLHLNWGADPGPHLPGLCGRQRPGQLDLLLLQLPRLLPEPPHLLLPALGPRHPRASALPPAHEPGRLQAHAAGRGDSGGRGCHSGVGERGRRCCQAALQKLQLGSVHSVSAELGVVQLAFGHLRGELRDDKAAKHLGEPLLTNQRGRRAKHRPRLQNGDVKHREGPDRWGVRSLIPSKHSVTVVSSVARVVWVLQWEIAFPFPQ